MRSLMSKCQLQFGTRFFWGRRKRCLLLLPGLVVPHTRVRLVGLVELGSWKFLLFRIRRCCGEGHCPSPNSVSFLRKLSPCR